MAEEPFPGKLPEPDLDIAAILEGWDYKPGEVVTRRVFDAAGRQKIQMRLALGLIQMEVDGRPDGQRPHGAESLLERHQERLRQYKAAHGGEEGFSLSHEECEELREEGLIYYYRYLCLFQLKDFARVARDTARNLRMVDFISAHCPLEADRLAAEQFRPYITMMNARAVAHLALERSDVQTAAAQVRQAIRSVRRFYRQAQREIEGLDAEELIEASGELKILQELLEEIQRLPAAQSLRPQDEEKEDRDSGPTVEDLRQQLKKAIEQEDYERAAMLRDRIKSLQKS